MSNNIYNIQSKHVWYNTSTNSTYDKRVNKDDIKFDSKAEFKFYLELKDICDALDIVIYKDCHLTLDDKVWIVDFKLVFPLSLLNKFNKLLSKINNKEIKLELPIIYIEYKGVLTDSSMSKLDSLFNSKYNDKLIMVSQKAITYMKEDTKNLKFNIKPIFSTKFFMLVLFRILLSD